MIKDLQEAIAHCHEKIAEQKHEALSMLAYNEDIEPSRYKAQCLECAKDHEQLVAWLEELEERREADRWIPVTERLPNTLGVYNVTRKSNEGKTIYFISDASYFDGQNTWYADTGINHGRPYLTDIIAWKPLSEPYEENDNA